MEQNQNLLSSDLQVDNVAHMHLKETAMWGKFLAITGFVLSGLMLLLALFTESLLKSSNSFRSGEDALQASIVYGIIALVYFVLSLYLLRFSAKMKTALQTIDQESFNSALLNLKLLYRISGIMAIIFIALMVLAIVVIVGYAAFAA